MTQAAAKNAKNKVGEKEKEIKRKKIKEKDEESKYLPLKV